MGLYISEFFYAVLHNNPSMSIAYIKKHLFTGLRHSLFTGLRHFFYGLGVHLGVFSILVTLRYKLNEHTLTRAYLCDSIRE